MLLAEASHDFWRPFKIGIHVFFPQPLDHHAHPLQRRGERELTHNPDLEGLRGTRHITLKLSAELKKKSNYKEQGDILGMHAGWNVC